MAKKLLTKEQFRESRLSPRFCQGVFGRYQGEISDEILRKVDEEFVCYQKRAELDKQINKLRLLKEKRTPEQGREIAALIDQRKKLIYTNATGITGEQYKKQALFYKSIQEAFKLIAMLSENAFSFIYFPFLIDRLSENLSDAAYKKLSYVEYLMKFHSCHTYDDYIMLHSFFLQLHEARYPLARFRKY